MIRSTGTIPRRLVSAAAMLFASVSLAAPPECRCRDPGGERRDLGTVECVDIAGTPWLVRCEMSTNTPYWKRLRDTSGCPLA